MLLDDVIKEIEEEEKAPGAHSIIGASSADRWFNCPGSVVLSEGIPGTTSGAAIEGTFLHKLGEMLLSKRLVTTEVESWEGEEIEVLDHTFKLNEQMIEGVLLYFGAVLDCMRGKANPLLFVEEKFCINSVSDRAFGTADAVINEPFSSLEVIDLKTGYKRVNPESKQLKYYALGVLEKYDTDIDTVRLTIVQPREGEDYRVKTFALTRAELMEFKKELQEAVDRVDNATDKDLCIGEWCFFCKAKPTCPKQHETALEVAQNGFDEIEPKEPQDLTTNQIDWLLKNKEAIEEFLSSVHDYATEQAKLGHQYEGFKLVNRLGNRAWNPEAEDHLVSKLGEDAYKVTKKLLSPAQAEKMFKEKLGVKLKDAKEELASYAFKPEKGVALVEEADKRPAVTLFDDLI